MWGFVEAAPEPAELALPAAERVLAREVTEAVVAVRRWTGRGRPGPDSSSEVREDEAWEDGGEMVSMPGKTRAQGARVRRVGPRSGLELGPDSFPLSWRLGSVRAQFSHGPARRVTYSSYVLRNS